MGNNFPPPVPPAMQYVYCDGCGEIVPFVTDFLPADSRNSHSALDIVCKECDLVITTFHESTSPHI